MMKILVFLSLLFAVVITATQVVIYQFELVQLDQEFVTKFNLKEFEAKFPKDGSFLVLQLSSKTNGTEHRFAVGPDEL
jgi:cell division protein FtsL